MRDPVQGHKVLSESVWQYCKALLVAEHQLEVVVKPKTRNGEQNAKLHAMLSDISAQKEYHGQKLSIETWKRLLMAAFLRATNENVQIYPAIDGNGMDIVYEHTSKMTIKQCAELISFIEAWGVDQGVIFEDLQDYYE